MKGRYELTISTNYVPDLDLTIEVAGITKEEYDNIVDKKLNIQNNIKCNTVEGMGKISLDRDRKLVNTFDLQWETYMMWKKAFSK